MIREVLDINDSLYLSYAWIKNLGISERTIWKWKERNTGNRFSQGKVSYIEYSSIPESTRAKLPSEAEIRASIVADEKNSLLDSYLRQLRYAQQNKFLDFQKKYRDQFNLPVDKAREKGMKAAVWQKVLFICNECKAGGKKLPNGVGEALYKAYDEIYRGSYSSLQAFSRAINHVSERGPFEYCIDGRLLSNKTGHA